MLRVCQIGIGSISEYWINAIKKISRTIQISGNM